MSLLHQQKLHFFYPEITSALFYLLHFPPNWQPPRVCGCTFHRRGGRERETEREEKRGDEMRAALIPAVFVSH